MATSYYISPTDQATANLDETKHAALIAQGFRRVSYFRWLLHCERNRLHALAARLPVIILALGAVLRVAGTGAAAIWCDETILLARTGVPFLKLLSEQSENSGDLLLELLIRPLMAINHSLWLLRLPSMLAGLVSLWLVWKLMRRLDFSLRQQIITSAIVACLPGLLWMNQDARAYNLLACLFLAAIWFALEANWLALLAVCGLTIYAHNIGPLCAAAALAIAAWTHRRKLRFVLIVTAVTALAWIPAIIRILGHWIIQFPWQPQLTFPWLVTMTLQALWPVTFVGFTVLIPLAVLCLTLLLLISVRLEPGRLVPLMAWLLPYIGMIVFCRIVDQNVILYRTLMPMLYPFALWLGWELGDRRFSARIPLAAWTVMLVLGLVIWRPSDRGGHLDLVAEQIRSQWRTGDILVYTTNTVGLPFDYYLNDLPHTWDDTIIEPLFYNVPTIPRTWLDTPTGDVLRSWVVIPTDGVLINPEEQAALLDLVHHQEPVYTISYMQVATVNIYLVEEP
jgi:hypothetical protein